jgi:hypothetical protein
MSGSTVVLASGVRCELCGRTGEHECMALWIPPKFREQEETKEIETLRRKIRDLEDGFHELSKSWANHHIVETNTTYTCRCGKNFWAIFAFNKHVEEEGPGIP